ncbi:MAG: CehA/McbA family metallohydrolase [Candidatus Pacebacteria bacterium]|nr:CehA/McbA family metallohydrolase [Candidatus Paceibacterota bacterium]
MPRTTFEDHLHVIPDHGVPYAPAWDGDDRRCLAWTAYRPDRELLRVRVEDRECELLRSDAVGKPSVIQVADAVWEVDAPVCEAGSWSCRRFRVTKTGADILPNWIEAGSFIETVRLLTKRSAKAEDDVFAAVTREEEKGPRVMLLQAEGKCVRDILKTPASLRAYRPVPVFWGGRFALVFDAWDGSAYRIYLQTETEIVCLSDESAQSWQLAADAVTGLDGALYVGWIRDTDVMNPEGVTDARCELMAARLTMRNGATHVKSFGAVDDLSHGLLDLSPKPRGVWGYCGRRRHPMLLRTPQGVTLVWEQKEIHDGPTCENRGVLWGRCLNHDGAGKPMALAEGGLHYEIAGSHALGSEPAVACYEGMFTDERQIVFKPLASLPLDKTRLPREAWDDWHPVDLPQPEMKSTERAVMEADGKTYSLYWFDLHCHTALSGDAEGEVDMCYRTAKHKAALDGVLMTDNDHYVVPLNHNEWRTSCALADAFDEPGTFVALIGYEWTCRREVENELIVDHRSVLLPAPTPDIVRWNEVSADPRALYEFLDCHGGFAHAHHQHWRVLGNPLEVNIEAASSWDPYLEREPEFYHAALKAGHRLGVIGGSDEHRRNPGLGGALTGVWAESLTRDSILDALRNRRCIATAGHRVAIDFRVNGQPMGKTITANSVKVDLHVQAPTGIESVELIRDGDTVRTWDVDGTHEYSAGFEERPGAGTHFYYVKVLLEGRLRFREALPANLQQLFGSHGWSSPVWVTAGSSQ